MEKAQHIPPLRRLTLKAATEGRPEMFLTNADQSEIGRDVLRRLEHLGLTGALVQSWESSAFTDLVTLRLCRLQLPPSATFESILRSYPRLDTLELDSAKPSPTLPPSDSNPEISDHRLIALRYLRVLSLKGIGALFSAYLFSRLLTPSLDQLDLHGSPTGTQVTTDILAPAILSYIASQCHPQPGKPCRITRFYLNSYRFLKPAFFLDTTKHLPRLKKLRLAPCDVDDTLLIACEYPHLFDLHLRKNGPSRVSASALMEFAKSKHFAGRLLQRLTMGRRLTRHGKLR
jgi:hypothetical protein